LISRNPSVAASKDSYPVLLPGLDSLNHARGRPVSWVVDSLPPTGPGGDLGQQLGLSLVIHSPTRSGEELLNNYGAKPNSELILGYGFSLERNPDDTIVLSIGGGPPTSASDSEEKRWEVGRNARGVEGVWQHVFGVVSSASQPEEAEESAATRLENQLDAASMLSEMCRSYLERLPVIPDGLSDASTPAIRPEVSTMFAHYIEGAQVFQDVITSTNVLEPRPARRLGIDPEICRRERGGSGGRSSETRYLS